MIVFLLPIGNFVVGFSTRYQLDCDNNGGGIILYVRENIPFNLLATKKHQVGFM